MTTDLSTQTPREIDTALAEIYGRLYKIEDSISHALKSIDELEEGMEREEQGVRGYTGWISMYTQRVLTLRDSVTELQQARREALAETAPYEAEYQRRPWSRFFLVQNNGGHIHSSMSCSTCNKRGQSTRFGWLPELSGKTEPEAVAEHGAILCTVCYPSAPVEWTDRRDPSVCEGSGSYLNRDLPHRAGFYTGNWGTCEACGTRQTVTSASKIRKHKKENNG
jgi:hypothetical protein